MKPRKAANDHSVVSAPFGPGHLSAPPLPAVLESFRDRFERDGYAHQTQSELAPIVAASAVSWIALAAAAGRDAPIDENPGGRESRRHRYYSTGSFSRRAARGSRFLLFPPYVDSNGRVFTTYLQPAGANRDYGRERRFEPLPDELLGHVGLQEIVELCYRATPGSIFPGDGADLLKVGIHLISLQPEKGQAAISSPNRAHFDGEYVTYIVMLERSEVIGGDSLVVERTYADWHPDDVPEEGRLFRVTLAEPLDLLGTDDRRICHYVYPVFARRNGRGRRTVLLIDFTPLAGEMSNERLDRE